MKTNIFVSLFLILTIIIKFCYIFIINLNKMDFQNILSIRIIMIIYFLKIKLFFLEVCQLNKMIMYIIIKIYLNNDNIYIK